MAKTKEAKKLRGFIKHSYTNSQVDQNLKTTEGDENSLSRLVQDAYPKAKI